MNFKKIAQQQTTLSDLMSERVKVPMEEIIIEYPNGFHLTDFDLISIDDSENFVVFTIREDKTIFSFGGTILTNIVKEWIKEFNGDITATREAYSKEEPILIKAKKEKTRTGRTITRLIIV